MLWQLKCHIWGLALLSHMVIFSSIFKKIGSTPNMEVELMTLFLFTKREAGAGYTLTQPDIHLVTPLTLTIPSEVGAATPVSQIRKTSPREVR